MAYTGSQLKSIREQRGIPLEQVASATRIRLSILQDIEDEEYSELSSSTQTRGFIRLYTDFLGLQELPVETTLKVLESLPEKQQEPVKQENEPPNLKIRKTKPVAENQPVALSEETSESKKDLEAIGRELSARRRYLNVSWDVIEEETHIHKDQLRSIERGDLDAFINPIHFKGLLQTYARFLNLDVAAIMIRYADAIQKRRSEKTTTKRKILKSVRVASPFLMNLKRFFTLDLFFGTLMIIGIVGFLIWGISRMSFAGEEPELTGTLPALAEVLLSDETEQPTETEPTAETQEVVLIPTSTPFYIASEMDASLEIVILIRQNTWLRVLSDGQQVYQGRQQAGNVLTYTGDESIELQTGNLAAIEVIFNQEPYDGTTSRIGTAARLLFSSEGINELPVIEIESGT